MNTPFFLSRLREQLLAQFTKHPLRTALPILAVTGGALAAVVAVTSCTICCTVSSNGERVALCSDTQTLEAAIDQAEAKAAAILHTPYSFAEDAVSSHPAVAPKANIEAVSGVTDSLLDAIPEIEHVYTLSVDGNYVGANEDPAVLENALAEVQKLYETRETISTHVDSDVSIQWEYVPAEQGTETEQQLVNALLEETPKSFSYIVQTGDDPVSVAENFGMTLARLQELNPAVDLSVYVEAESILTDSQTEETAAPETSPYAALADVSKPPENGTSPYAALADTEKAAAEQTVSVRDFLTATENPLQTGQTLTIEQSCPLLEVTTIEETAFTRSIEPERQVQSDDTLYAGQERILQEGANGYADVVARQVRRCGVLTVSTDLSSEVITEPTPVIVASGTMAIPSLSDGLFLWPVRGHISSDFGYRFIFGGTNFHRGVDIAAAMGTPICAADSGTVVYAGVRGTYGNLVVIAHPSGLYTYYGHCSQIFAGVGDSVAAGDVVAAVGSTGRSTGPHCHFEVRYENAPIDPLQFLPDANNAPLRSVPISTAAELIPSSAPQTAQTASAASSQSSSKPSASQTGKATSRSASSGKASATGQAAVSGKSANTGKAAGTGEDTETPAVSGRKALSGKTAGGSDIQQTAPQEAPSAAASEPSNAGAASSDPAPSVEQ